MAKQVFHLNTDFIRKRVKSIIDVIPKGWVVTIQPPTRTLVQNKRMWAMLAEISKKIEYEGAYRSDHDWKAIFSASLKGESVDAVPTLDGKRTILLGLQTSKMSVSEMTDLMTVMEMYCATKGVILTDNRESA